MWHNSVVSEFRNKSYNANVLWVSLSSLIPHVIDPQSIGKAVQWKKYAPNANQKSNTVWFQQIFVKIINYCLLLIIYNNIPTSFSMIYSIVAYVYYLY